VLRSKIKIEHGPRWIEKNPKSNPIVFECMDPEFVETPLATALPTVPLQAPHPGWKPNHRFEVPVAIIDPNNHVQVAGVNVADGSLDVGSGCWNFLTTQFGGEGEKKSP
jgi:hypothetical protein